MVDYRVWYDNSSNGDSFVAFASGIVDTDYIATGLTQGSTYQFKVESRNIYGYSALYSNTVTILAAQIPAIPDAPTTEFVAVDDTIKVTWVAPDDGGSPITGYTVVFRHSDGVSVSTQLDHCDASQSEIFTVTVCTVPAAILNAAPFNLPWGTEAFA